MARQVGEGRGEQGEIAPGRPRVIRALAIVAAELSFAWPEP